MVSLVVSWDVTFESTWEEVDSFAILRETLKLRTEVNNMEREKKTDEKYFFVSHDDLETWNHSEDWEMRHRRWVNPWEE